MPPPRWKWKENMNRVVRMDRSMMLLSSPLLVLLAMLQGLLASGPSSVAGSSVIIKDSEYENSKQAYIPRSTHITMFTVRVLFICVKHINHAYYVDIRFCIRE